MKRSLKNILIINKCLLIEGGILLLATPFLLFGSYFPVVTFLCVGLLFVSWLVSRLLCGNGMLPRSIFSTLVLLVGVQMVVGVWVSADKSLSLEKAAALFLGIAWFRFLSTYGESKSSFKWGVFFFVGLGLLLTMLGILTADWSLQKVEFVQIIILRLPSLAEQIAVGREGGTHTNQIGGSILFHIFLLPAIFLTKRFNHLVRYLAGAGFFIVTALLVLTQSRSAWLGYAVGLIVVVLGLAVFLKKSRLQLIMRTASLIVLLGLAIAIVSAITSGFALEFIIDPRIDTSFGNLGTINFRQEVWQWGWQGGKDFLFTGAGLGAFRHVVHRLYPIAVPVSYDIAHAHNQFLQVQLDLGLLGTCAYAALFGLAIIACIKVARKSEQYAILAIGFVGCLIGFHIFGMLDAIALGAKPSILWWILLALISSMYQLQVAED